MNAQTKRSCSRKAAMGRAENSAAIRQHSGRPICPTISGELPFPPTDSSPTRRVAFSHWRFPPRREIEAKEGERSAEHLTRRGWELSKQGRQKERCEGREVQWSTSKTNTSVHRTVLSHTPIKRNLGMKVFESKRPTHSNDSFKQRE